MDKLKKSISCGLSWHVFGCRACFPQNLGMNEQRNAHVPFAQLPMVERFFYLLGAMIAVGPLLAGNATKEELKDDLIRIWDEERFTPADAANFPAMADRLKPLVTRYIVNDPRIWLPESPRRKRR